MDYNNSSNNNGSQPGGGGGGGYYSSSYGDSSSGSPYSMYGASSGYPSSYGPSSSATAAASSSVAQSPAAALRKRSAADSSLRSGARSSVGGHAHAHRPPPSVIKRLDFMFPKVESEFTVQTQKGGIASLVAYSLVILLALTEIATWMGQNRSTKEHIFVDTSLGKRMRINIDITFPALSCVDLHVDAMDVAGDSQLDIEDTLVKKQLHLDGTPLSSEELRVETNTHRQLQEKKEKILKDKLPENYCGPCFGAHESDNQCCQTCDELLAAYKKKRWRSDVLLYTAEQCIREGRDKQEPKRMSKGQGCNLSGYMVVNRVAGNFHIAMGEGIERDGRHIHTFVPEDSPNFNASHIIHHLSFGPVDDSGAPLNGVKKIVTTEHGTTGLFQYFIKVVPTSYVGKKSFPRQWAAAAAAAATGAAADPPTLSSSSSSSSDHGDSDSDTNPDVLETNRYFVTERFRPLMTEYLEDGHMEKDDTGKAGVQAGSAGGHAQKDHHKIQNSVLPGVFFIYEIYPFAIEISKNSVPFTHLLIRLMATVGGVFAVVRWANSWLS